MPYMTFYVFLFTEYCWLQTAVVHDAKLSLFWNKRLVDLKNLTLKSCISISNSWFLKQFIKKSYAGKKIKWPFSGEK